MASIEEMARRELVNDSAVSGKVGDRVYPQRIEVNQPFPAIHYSKISKNARGAMLGRTGPIETRIQYDCFETEGNYQNLNDLCQDIIRLFEGWSGQMGWSPGIQVGSTKIMGPRDMEWDEADIYHQQLDVLFLHQKESA